jgi:hypothetical protein
MFHSKTVALIGPAPHILERVQDLSNFDLVCMVNNMLPISPELARAVGSRCDVWYPANMLLQAKPELCKHPDVKIIRTTKTAAAHIPEPCLYKWSRAKWPLHALMQQLGCMPNRGMRAMIDILSHNPAKLYITGFTFYQGSAYFPGYTTAEYNQYTIQKAGNLGDHLQEPQIDYFKKNILPHPAVEVDWKLKKMFEAAIL